MSEFASSGFFVLRAPLLSIDELLQLASPVRGATDAVPASPRAASHTRLVQWLERPSTQEALWIASPHLLASLAPWREDPGSARGQKLERALYRYFARMTSRPTPFGTFAACTLGEVGERTHLELAARDRCRRHTRLDMEFLCSLAEAVARDPALRRHVVFRPNDTLHMAAGKYHHLRHRLDDGARVYHLVATEPTPALVATVERAANGGTVDGLVFALLADDPEINLAQAEEFMATLVESQVLVSALTPPVTGADPLKHLISQLERARAPGLASELRSLAADLRALDAEGIGADLARYEKITRRATGLPAAFRPGHLVQVDVTRPAATATLAQGLVDEILDAIAALHSIHGDSVQPALQAFREEFVLRYQGREVPLLEALDDEAGIGFESEDNAAAEPLLAGIGFQLAGPESSEEGAVEENALVRRVEQLARNRETVLRLDAQLLRELAIDRPLPMPDSFAVVGRCFRHPDGKEGFHLQAVSGPSGANLVARFCYADPRLAGHVRDHLRAGDALHRGDGLFAEIVHLPEGRIGNVVSRPVLRDHEIAFLATPGVPPDRQLALADLTLSVRGERIVLRSKRLDREVIPRLTSAHDFTAARNLKIYKFIGLLQQQGVTAELAWRWGPVLPRNFLPRVVLGNVVLSPACWIIDLESARHLCLAQGDEQLQRVEEWREANHVPRFAAIAEGDNHLLLDLESPLGVESFLDHVGKRADTLLVEMFPAPVGMEARGPEGPYVHEIVLPIVRKSPASAREPIGATIGASPAPLPAPRTRVATFEWLFAKLYCSPSHADRLLLELVKPLAQEALACGAADGWFFMRYADPHWHLRLRFHGEPAAVGSRILPMIHERADEHRRRGTLWRLEFDDYEPEVERYGGPSGIRVAESLFRIDSELCLELLELATGGTDSQLRWQLALCGCDQLMSALGLGLEEKRIVAADMARACRRDFIIDQDHKDQMARKAREQGGAVARLLGQVPAEAVEALARFSSRLPVVRGRLEDLARAGKLTRSVPELAFDFAHMHLNRMFRSRHREQEAVVCELLSRAYAMALAQGSG